MTPDEFTPEFWKYYFNNPMLSFEPSRGERIHVCLKNIGAVTVDFYMRNFALGCVPVRDSMKSVYRGRNWKIKLMEDAVARLLRCK